MDLNENQAEAVQLIDSKNLQQWINRSLEDPAAETRLEQAIEMAQEFGRGPGYWDRLLSRVCIALDPESPIRFKGLNLHPEGLPAALTEAVATKQEVQPFVDIINQQLVLYWLNAQTSLQVDIGSLVTRYDSCRGFLRQANLGYGLERCVYFLDPETPCLSDRVSKYFVRTPEDIMYALEDLAEDPDRPALFIDRHIAAFLSIKDRKVIDAYWADLNAEQFSRRALGNVMVLAEIQKRGRMERFPRISRWVVDILEPVYERYHDRELRVQLKKKVEKLKDSGDVVKIAAIFDDNELLQRDFLAFRQAMNDYQNLKGEYAALREKAGNPETFAEEAGKEAAAVVAGILAGIVILGLSFVYFIGAGF